MSSPSHRLADRLRATAQRAASDSAPAWAGWARNLLFFGLLYLYLWRVVDLHLIYYAAGMVSDFPTFFRGAAFFRSFTSYPGGLVEYLSAFLAQWFYYPWSAALVVTLQAWLLAACGGVVLDAAGASRFRWVRFGFPIGLLVIGSQYAYPFAAATALVVALIASCLYVTIASRLHRLAAAPLVLVLSVMIYYAAGGGYLLFAVLCAPYELLRRRWLASGLCLALVFAVPYVVGVLIFRVSMTMAFIACLPVSSKTGFAMPGDVISLAGTALYLVLPAVLILDLLLQVVWHRQPSPETRPKKAKKHKQPGLVSSLRSWYDRTPVVRWTLGIVTLLAATASAAMMSYDDVRKATFQVHCYACQRKWPEVLQIARHASFSFSTMNAVDRALYHTGRMGSDMFAWPQRPEALLINGHDQNMTYWTKFDTLMDLGLVNAAQKNFTECLEVYGPHPLILRRLALANMVKGNVDAARILLGALSKTLFHARWANDYLARLQADPDLSGDERITQLRSVCMKENAPSIFLPTEWQLSTLLKENGGNRMAFEYLMSSYLLNRQLDKFIGCLDRFDALGYGAFPRHYEEAILVYAYTKRQSVFLYGRQIAPQAKLDIEQFSQTFNRYGKDKQAALHELASRYGDSYFFFNLYGLSGVKR